MTQDNVPTTCTTVLPAGMGRNRKKGNRKQILTSAPSLCPPTLMIDLLFGALMLFAFQMGDPNARDVVSKSIALPTSNEETSEDKHDLLALTPVKEGNSPWQYELPDGKRLVASEVAKVIKTTRQTPVLVVSSKARVQNYIDAEQPLRRLGLKVGLAVEVEQGGHS